MCRVLLSFCLLFLLNAQALAAATRFCPPFEQPKDFDRKRVLIGKGEMQDFQGQLRSASPNTTFVLADGTYTLSPHESLEINQPRMTIRSASGNRDAVIIAGGDINIGVNADDFTVADVTLRTPRFHNVQVRGERGIALGLMQPQGASNIRYDHQNGLVENNVILAWTEPADAAIENNSALSSRIFHNIVYYNETLKHAVKWSIEYRFPSTTAIIKNNLTNLPIIKRDAPEQEAVMAGNLTNASADWFRNVAAGDVHLTERIGRGVALPESPEDMDGNPRPEGRAPDPGAYEFSGLSTDTGSQKTARPRPSQVK